ncbi:sensor histidine kinase [Streptacidiphilus jiangxiensis]|uniref:histidine kinase n=1 Tax=Streptacidiphilus jiangxiensis TaxID=235985 RepID=A0A1H7W4B4_STRJI|nr:histidine kinase [Streptacidiphilus jiangxiensis]SEM15828.1 Signal transduction histidine kinase [Streptacidiphilus jiangxiensis]
MLIHRTIRRVFGPYGRQGVRDIVFLASAVPPALLPGFVLLVWPSGFALFLLPPVTLVLVPLLTRIQRSRFRSLLGLDIPVVPPIRPRLRAFTAETTWRQFLYHVLVNVGVALYALGVVFVATAGLVGVTLPAWYFALPNDLLPSAPAPGKQPDVLVVAVTHHGVTWIAVLGAIALVAVPWLALFGRAMDTRAAAGLLGPNRTRELVRRVEDLAESRAEVVDAADAERRRIERDLHDGAQQRMVSLAMNLGLARRMLRNLPAEEQAAKAMTVIAEAHDEAQAAIAELRDLVRGLHPVVLEDRGLDAALSGIAARAPLPVKLDVRMQRRAAPAVEAVAYFVVSEALANVAKHARASRAEVLVDQRRELLHITVTDDGVGGADPGKGTGLVGLRQRAASVDGTLRITSPLGGPTTLLVELPCVL